MEAKLALRLTEQMFANKNGRIYLQKIVSNDNSTTRSLFQHKKNHEKALLSPNILQPLFLADPSHRIKVM